MKTSNFTIHKNQSKGFTIMPNSISYDYELSLKAFGLLCKLHMLPEDWEFSEAGLSSLFKDSRTAIRSAVRELEDRGYLIRERVRDERGRLKGTQYHIFESPMELNERTGEFEEFNPLKDIPKYEFPATNASTPMLDLPMSENPTLGAHMLGAEHNIILNNKTSNELNTLTIDPLGANRTEEPKSIGKKTGEDQTSAIKVLKKKYKSAFVELALELAKDKDDQIAYARAVLRDWKKQKFETVEQVKQHVAAFNEDQVPNHLATIKSYAGNRVKRVEQTPEWLNQEQQTYNANIEYTEDQLKAIDRMKQLQQIVLNPNHKNVENDEFGLPF